MPLLPIPLNLKPTAAELQEELAKVPATVGDAIRQGLARITWETRKQKDDPNAFLVPFAHYPWLLAERVAGYAAFARDYADYETYLRSPLWQAIRDRALKLAGNECAACPNKATQVHHRDYRLRVLLGEDLTPLVALCAACHKKVDKVGKRARESWNEKERILAALVAKKDKATLARP